MKKYIIAFIISVSTIPFAHAETWKQKGFCSAGSMVGNNLVICNEATIATENGYIKHAMIHSIPEIVMNMDETGKMHSLSIGGQYHDVYSGGCSYDNTGMECHAITNNKDYVNVVFNMD